MTFFSRASNASASRKKFVTLIKRFFRSDKSSSGLPRRISRYLRRSSVSWSAVPFPSSIGLYQKGQGYPKFDQAKADEYYKKVTDKVADLIVEVRGKWNLAGL